MRFVKLLISAIGLFAAGIVLLVLFGRDAAESRNPRNIAGMGADDFHSGRHVTGKITELWDEFATMQDEDTGKVTAHYFALPLQATIYDDEPIFVAVVIKNSSDYLTAKKMANEADDWYSDDVPLTTTMEVNGKVAKLDSEEYDALLSYIKDGQGLSAQNIARYKINIGATKNSMTPMLIIGIVMCVVGLIIGFIAVLRRLQGKI